MIDRCSCQTPARKSQPLADRRISVTLPESGTGFRTYNREPEGADQVGRQGTIDFLVRTGEVWSGLSDVPFQVGDISRRGGGPFPPHEGHKIGTEADLRPFRRDKAMEPTNINDPSYDPTTTRKFVETLKKLQPNAIVFFNDPVLIRAGLTLHAKGHHNHLHLRLPA